MTDLSVGGFVPFSSVDFPLVSVSCVVFCQGCPWSCRYCQNKELQQFKANVSFFEEIFPQIVERKGFLDGVVFSGGEPLVQHAIVEAARRVKAEGFKVALHTAGGFPSVLQDVMEYVDWVGFDIKAPLERYMEVVMPGVASDAPKSAVGSPQDCVKMSLDILKKSGKSFECRTTVDPQIIDRKDLIDIAKFLASTIGIRPIGPLSKPSKSEFWEGDTEHRSGAYLDVREHSSTGSTYPKTDFEEFGKRSIAKDSDAVFFAGTSEHRSATYSNVRDRSHTKVVKTFTGTELSSTETTNQKAASDDFGNRSNECSFAIQECYDRERNRMYSSCFDADFIATLLDIFPNIIVRAHQSDHL